jgi:hypothetical protein
MTGTNSQRSARQNRASEKEKQKHGKKDEARNLVSRKIAESKKEAKRQLYAAREQINQPGKSRPILG